MPYIICPECSKNFYVKPSRPEIKFCSTKCRSKSRRCFVSCKYCGNKFEVIKSRQNKAAFCSPECQEDFLDKFHRIIRLCLSCGKKFTRKKYRQNKKSRSRVRFCSIKCANKYLFKDKPFSKKHCQRISKALTGKPKSKEHIEKMKGDNNPSKRPEVKQKIREARLRQVFPIRDTKIEILLQEELRRRGFKFQKHIPVERICQPDIVFPDKKIVIEADGDYWHSLPKAIVKDRRNNKLLRKRGWKVFRFSETQINNNVKECINQVEKLLLK